jgi:hypothetical protein
LPAPALKRKPPRKSKAGEAFVETLEQKIDRNSQGCPRGAFTAGCELQPTGVLLELDLSSGAVDADKYWQSR